MKVTFRAILGVLFVFATLSLGRAQPGESTGDAPRSDLPNYHEVTPGLATAGQPTEAGLRLLAERGFKAVINLRTDGEKGVLPDQEKLTAGYGMQYFNIPVGKAPEDRQVRKFMDILDDLGDQRVFVHCATANRAGSFILIERVMREGWSLQRAANEAARAGLRSETLRRFALGFIEKHRAQ